MRQAREILSDRCEIIALTSTLMLIIVALGLLFYSSGFQEEPLSKGEVFDADATIEIQDNHSFLCDHRNYICYRLEKNESVSFSDNDTVTIK